MAAERDQFIEFWEVLDGSENGPLLRSLSREECEQFIAEYFTANGWDVPDVIGCNELPNQQGYIYLRRVVLKLGRLSDADREGPWIQIP